MNLKKTMLLACLFTGGHAFAQIHVHDQGEIFISQQLSMWHVEFAIPAVNAFGFEHLPENHKQQQVINQFVQSLAQSKNFIELPQGCVVVDSNEEISGVYKTTESDHKHDNHGHNEHEHHDETHQGSHQESHLNASFSYTFNCPSKVSQLTISAFSALKGLHKFSAQWITEQGQGGAQVHQNNPKIRF